VDAPIATLAPIVLPTPVEKLYKVVAAYIKELAIIEILLTSYPLDIVPKEPHKAIRFSNAATASPMELLTVSILPAALFAAEVAAEPLAVAVEP